MQLIIHHHHSLLKCEDNPTNSLADNPIWTAKEPKLPTVPLSTTVKVKSIGFTADEAVVPEITPAGDKMTSFPREDREGDTE